MLASSIFRVLGRLFQQPVVLWGMMVALAAFTAPLFRWIRQSVLDAKAGHWPEMPASIDVVSVVEREEENHTTTYVATLTYFYRNPDLQMGEYERVFPLKAAAESWVEQFKARQIMVRVDPRRPERSILPDSIVKSATIREAPSLEEALRMEKIPELPGRYRLLSGICELIGSVGLISCVAMLLVCVLRGGKGFPSWALWSAGGALAFTFVSIWIVDLRFNDETEYGDFLRKSSVWCPGWMRWGLKISGGVFTLYWFLARIDPVLLRRLLMGTDPFMPYVWLAWGFLITTGFHAAIVRSQEQSRGMPSASDPIAQVGSDRAAVLRKVLPQGLKPR
jgi:hypothetical protein